MNAQSPAERIDLLRKSFFEAGKSMESMSRQERKLLEQQTGLTGAALDAAFANESMGTSYEDITAGAEDAEAKQLTQAEAMKELSDSIQKMTKTGSSSFKGFFDAFIKGFERGIKRSAPFRKIMRNIRKSLRIVHRAGIQVGKMFVKMFPGVKKMMQGLADMFDPARYARLMVKVKTIFRKFFTDLKKDPKAGVDSFIKHMTDAFKGFFKSGGTAGKKVLEGGKTMIKAMWTVFKVLLIKSAEGLAKLLDMISARLEKGFSGAGAVASAIKVALMSLAKSIGKLLLTMWTIIKPPLIKMFLTLFEKSKPFLKKAGAAILAVIIGKMILTAVANAMIGAVVAQGAKMIGAGLGKMMGAATPEIPGGGGQGPAALGETLKGGFAGMASGLKVFVDTIALIPFKSIVQSGAKMALMAVAFLPAMAIMAMGILMVTAIISTMPIKQVLGAMAAFALATVAMGIIATVGALIPFALIGPAMLGLIGGAALMAVAGVAFAMSLRVIANVFKGVPWKEVAIGMVALAISVASLTAMAYAASLILPVLTTGLFGLGAAAVFSAALVGFAVALAWLANHEAWASVVGHLPKLAPAFANLAMIMGSLAITAIAAVAAGAAGLLALIPLVGVAAFLGALMVTTLLLSGFATVASTISSWSGLAGTFLAMTGIFLALSIIGPLAIVAGITGVLAAVYSGGIAMFSVALAEIVVPALGIMAEASSKVKWGVLGTTFLKLVGIFGAIAIIAPIAVFAGVASAYAAFAVGGIALFAMAMAIPGGLIWSLGVMSTAIKGAKVDWKTLGVAFLQMIALFVGISILSVLAVATGAIALVGAAAVPLVGLFIAALSSTLGPALGMFVDKLSPHLTKLGGLKTGLEALALFFGVIGLVAVQALLMGSTFLNPFLPVVAGAGFAAILALAIALKDVMGPAISAINEVSMGDPGAFKEKVAAIDPILGVVGGLSDMVTGLAGLGDGSESAAILSAAQGFVGSLLGGLKDLIDKVISIELSAEQISQAMAVGQVMKPMAELMKAIQPDPEMLKAMRSEGLMGSDFDPKALEAMTKFTSALMCTMGEGIEKIMEVIKGVAKTLTKKTARKIRDILPLVADSIKLLGDMAKVFKDIGSITPPPGEKEAGTHLSKTLRFMRSVMDAVVGRGGSEGHIARVFEAVKTMAAGIKNPAQLAPKIKVISDSFGILGSFAKTMGDMQKLLPKSSETLSMREAMNFVFKPKTGLIAMITEALAGSATKPGAMGRVFDTIMNMAKGITIGDGTGAKIKIISDAFGVVGSFASAIGDAAGFMPPAGEVTNPTTFAARIKSAVDLITQLSDVIGKQMGKVLTAIVAMIKPKPGAKVSDVYKYRHSLKALPDAFKAMGEFTTALSSVGEIADPGASPGAIKKKIQDLAGVVGDDKVNESIRTAVAHLGKTSETLSKANFNVKTMENFGKFIDTTSNVIERAPEQLEARVMSIRDSFARLENMLMSFGDGSHPEILSVIKLGDSLSKDGKLTVTHENVNVNLTVKVQMSAEKLAEALILADVGIATTGNKSAP